MADRLRLLATLQGCDYCAAEGGTWCRTSSGGRASYLHTARTRVTASAWRLGWCTGQLDILESLLDNLDPDYRWSDVARGVLPRSPAVAADLLVRRDRARRWLDQIELDADAILA